MSWDAIFKIIISEAFEHYRLSSVAIVTEYGVEIIRSRIDILVEGIKCAETLPDGSWLKFLCEHGGYLNIIEVKAPSVKVDYETIKQVLMYKIALSMKKKIEFSEVSVFIIAPKISENLEKKLREKLDDKMRIHGGEGLYETKNAKALKIYIIAYDELDPEILGNETLCLLSTKENISKRAARRIIETFKPDNIIYSPALIYRPEVAEMTETEVIPKERLAKAVEVIGIEKLADALGPERLAKAVEVIGIEKLVLSIGLEKTFRALSEILKRLPPEKRKELLRILTDTVLNEK